MSQKFLTTMQQVNRHRRAGDVLCCSLRGIPRAVVSQIRYGQGAFQVQVVGESEEWRTPLKVWAEVVEAQVPTLFDDVISS